MTRLLFSTFCIIICICFFNTVFADVTYTGSSTIGMGIIENGAKELFEKKTGIDFGKIDMPGSGKGFKALIAGDFKMSGASRKLKLKEKKKKPYYKVIGYDAIAVFVHNNNPVKNLTKEQLKGIFTGKITNWKDVGGKDVSIKPNTEISGQGRATMQVFKKIVMDGLSYAKGLKEIDLPRDQIISLVKNENEICSVSMGLLNELSENEINKVKTVSVNGVKPDKKYIKEGTYLISRPLILLSKKLPKDDVKKFFDFIMSTEGQAIVGKRFVSVK